MIEFARTEFKIYRVIGKYERNRDDDLCVRLGNFYTGQFECEGYESNLKLGELIDLIEAGDVIECSINSLYSKTIKVREYIEPRTNTKYLGVDGFNIKNCKVHKIYTKEQLEEIGYKVKEE